MFRLGLLTSTAMTAVTLVLSGAPIGAYAQTDMHAASRDPNTRFLCTYGEFLVSSASAWGWNEHDIPRLNSTTWQHVAVPVTGHGQTVSRIRVVESPQYSGISSPFSAGIYSNTASGLPGNPITIGTGTVKTCGPVWISVAPTKLKRHTTYWIEESTRTGFGCRRSTALDANGNRRRQSRPSACSGSSSYVSVYWQADPYTKHKAYVQKHWWRREGRGSSSSTTPWTVQSTGPYLKLK